jgi:ADP-ribose pyrophosphatase
MRIEVLEDCTEGSRCDEGFLRMRRLVLRNCYPDGSISRSYRYDLVERNAIDAVAIVLEAQGQAGPKICLRTCLRPPLALRPGYDLPLEEPEGAVLLWEVPAGLVEREERGLDGLRACAARETVEEVGISLAPSAFEPFGPAVYLSPGVVPEKIHYLLAKVDVARCGNPIGDGSPTEERAEVRFVDVTSALLASRSGILRDVKTEVAVRRLAELRGIV